MKKAKLLVMVLAVCLTLCACGGEEKPVETTQPPVQTEAIEINLDNWEQFFTLSYVENWQKNDFGEYDDLKIDAVLTLKPEYLGRIAREEAAQLTLEFRCDGAVKGAEIDFTARTYTIVADRKVEPVQEILTIDCRQLEEPYTLTMGSLEPATVDGIRYIMVHENLEILRIQGTIHLYVQ